MRTIIDNILSNAPRGTLEQFTKELIETSEIKDAEIAAKDARIAQLEKELAAAKEALTKVEKLAVLDPLTGLTNRRGLQEAQEEITSGLSSGARAIFLFDIDFFKKKNDQYGHDGGDAVLVGMAEHLKKALRKEDRFIRYGGEEFVIITEVKNPEDAFTVSNRLRKGIEALEIPFGGQTIKLTSSFGFYAFGSEQEGITLAEAISHADRNLYDAKNSGRNRVVGSCYPEEVGKICARRAHMMTYPPRPVPQGANWRRPHAPAVKGPKEP